MAPPAEALRILLVDDAEAVREVIALMLDALGHVVTPADGAERALGLIAGGLALDLVLTDYHMPGMNGAELAREIRRRRPGLRIGVVTGTLDVADATSGVFDLVIVKPVTTTTLRQALADVRLRP